jgi:hypothetical protein
MVEFVFLWNADPCHTAQIKAELDGREPTVEEIEEDANTAPFYSLQAYAVPPGTSEQRQRVRDIIDASGFWRNASTVPYWTALRRGKEVMGSLKKILQAQGVNATHFEGYWPSGLGLDPEGQL